MNLLWRKIRGRVVYFEKRGFMKKAKKEQIGKITKEFIFQSQKERYNPFQTGFGYHGDKKYNRKKNKFNVAKEMKNY